MATLLAPSVSFAAASNIILRARALLPVRPAVVAFAVPLGFNLKIPSFPDILESILRAVPKKKTSHSKKRMRQLAGKALKDITALNRCSACGAIKRSHMLCWNCVKSIKDMWAGKKGTPESTSVLE